VSIGAPPDPFSAEGQIWCLPPPNPIAPESIRIFAHLLQANMRHAGALRIDHAMALQRLFWVPDGARGAEGAYVSYPIDANLAEITLESERARCIVVGEDLGTVPEGFREKLSAADVLSYRVLFFERDGAAFRPAEAYPAKAVACVATHDLPTLAGWWAGNDIEERRSIGQMSAEAAAQDKAERVADKTRLAARVGEAALGATPEVPNEIVQAVHEFIADTPSVLAMAQVEDLIGERVAVNLPGTDRERPNWRRRLVPDVAAIFDGPTAALPQRQPGPKLED
jgi:glycogen operon protein